MIIGICGLASAGKDSIADFIIKDKPEFTKIKMAHHLKDVCSLLFSMDRKMLEGETPDDRIKREEIDTYWNERVYDNLKPFTPRKALQIIGTNLLRDKVCQDMWVACLEKKIKENNLKNVIIPDIRFPNEIDMIKRLNGKIIRVIRGETPDWFKKVESWQTISLSEPLPMPLSYYIPEINEIHTSEWQWIGYDRPDWIIKNDGSLDDLYTKVKKLNI